MEKSFPAWIRTGTDRSRSFSSALFFYFLAKRTLKFKAPFVSLFSYFVAIRRELKQNGKVSLILRLEPYEIATSSSPAPYEFTPPPPIQFTYCYYYSVIGQNTDEPLVAPPPASGAKAPF